jgi:6-pyruvoyltetrahydropterin/6-carboxytetrahydropterin synthase
LAYTIEITKEFGFEAAHHMPTMPAGHPYTRLHGHSFRVEVTVSGAPDPAFGWVVDFGVLEAALAHVRDQLDHHTLNDVPGLEQPTLEQVGQWIFGRIAETVPGLAEIVVRRDSIGERCRVRRA